MADRDRPAVLFVCLGNICRSPLAEAAFRDAAQKAGIDALADSAGTGNWHIGEPPDSRAQAIALAHGIDISHYRGRQLETADYSRFTHILALDGDNLSTIKARAPTQSIADIRLLMDFVLGREGMAVKDPYFGDTSDFEETWRDVSLAAEALAERLR